MLSYEPFSFSNSLIKALPLLLAGCMSCIDQELPVQKEIFDPNNSSITYMNSSSGEEFSFRINDFAFQSQPALEVIYELWHTNKYLPHAEPTINAR